MPTQINNYFLNYIYDKREKGKKTKKEKGKGE